MSSVLRRALVVAQIFRVLSLIALLPENLCTRRASVTEFLFHSWKAQQQQWAIRTRVNVSHHFIRHAAVMQSVSDLLLGALAAKWQRIGSASLLLVQSAYLCQLITT